MRRYLIDENISPEYRTQLRNHESSLKVLAVGDEGAPPKSTSDPEILVWCEQHQFSLITNNRESMPQHLSDHIAAGHHVPGIFTINLQVPMGKIIDELILIAGASDEDEYMDEIKYLPL
ncbi:hypothetical protein C6499_01470 [Candidatus Poribacteria bacterium]|nr:MAG: hypothetical protein C6499_01470 [Candidatus Poribacteria bacterium]